jgi:hypothetical protein
MLNTRRTIWALQKTLEALTAFGRKHVYAILGLVAILVITIVVFRNWIFTSQWPAGGDILGYISREYIYSRDYRWLFVWRPNSFGYPEGINSLDFFFMLLHFVAGNAVNTAKIFAISSFALAGFAMYAFGYHCTRRHLPALAGSLIYILNGQFLTQLTEAHLDIMFSYALAPIIFLLLDRALEKGKMKDIAAISILFGIIIAGFQPQMLFIYGPFVVLFVIVNVLRPQKLMRFRDVVKLRLKRIIIIVALAVVLSAFFWAPLVFNVRAPYLSTNFSRGNLEDAYINGYKTFYEAFTLAGKESWGYINVVDVTKGGSLQILPVPTILLFVFAFAYLITLVFRLNRYSLFFGLAALFSIILSMGPYLFESSFLWAWSNVPYFQSFRAISRWGMVTAFSTSFFVCVAASILTGYLQKFLHKPEEKLEVGVEIHRDLQKPRSLRFSLPDFDRLSHSIRRFLFYSAILALVAILLSGFISTWFLFSKGLQVYTPPKDYIQPYEYLSNISGEYKILSVDRSEADWYSASGEYMDFAYSSMLTSVGWSHDLGYESTFIHDKPTLQDGGLSGNFVNYLRYLTENNGTRNLLKLVGAFDYKYVVIPPYATEDLRDFFVLQYGEHLIYNQSNSIILENEFYVPRIFAPTQDALVIGAPESLSSLCDIDSFDFGKTAVILANQVDNFSALINNTAAIVFADADVSDLIMMPSSHVHLTYLADYGMRSLNASTYWIKNDWWTNTGALVLGGNTLTTLGNNKINIPIELDTEGDYDIMIRAAFAPNRGKLLVSLDGFPLADIVPYHANYQLGLRWINLTSNYHLEAGSHLITLLNDGIGYNDLDAIAIVEHSKLAHQAEETTNALQSFAGKILYIIEAENAFSQALPEGWFISAIPGEGYALHMEDGINIAPQSSASASSESDDGNLIAQYAIDGNPSTRWASSAGAPQWLEVTFPTPKEITGVGITFEAAYAKDYSIQTWNGTEWVDQIIVKNNSLLNRQDMFAQPITAEKLRILVTSDPAYNMVSIWDLQIFSDTNASSSEIFVPRRGEYNFAARLLPDEESNGTLYLKVDEKLFSINHLTNESEATWFELGSALLDVGEHKISVIASGSITLDKIGIYSTSDNESTIDDVFKSDMPAPSVSYEELNPCKYVVHVNCARPFLLVFSESEHPLWKAYVDNNEISPITVNSLANGFLINRTGSFDVVIYFTGQNVADIGLLISVGSTIFVVAVLIAKSTSAKKLKHFVPKRTQFRSKALKTEE